MCCRLYVVCNEGCWLERLTGLGWPRLAASGLAGLENDRAPKVIICRAAPSMRWLRNLVWGGHNVNFYEVKLKIGAWESQLYEVKLKFNVLQCQLYEVKLKIGA